ncbi:hypothetical protein SCALM49S_01088 [Streptomyces californicus]
MRPGARSGLPRIPKEVESPSERRRNRAWIPRCYDSRAGLLSTTPPPTGSGFGPAPVPKGDPPCDALVTPRPEVMGHHSGRSPRGHRFRPDTAYGAGARASPTSYARGRGRSGPHTAPGRGRPGAGGALGVLGQLQPAHLQLVALGDEFAQLRRRAWRPSRSRWRAPRSVRAASYSGGELVELPLDLLQLLLRGAGRLRRDRRGGGGGGSGGRTGGGGRGGTSSSILRRRSRYSSMPRGSIRRVRSPRSAMTRSVVRSMNRSWE